MPELSVIIPSFNRHHIIQKSLQYLEKQTIPSTEFEVIIVDDGSEPPIDVSANLANLSLIRIAHGGGAKARNVGINHARSPILLFLDDDVWVMPDTLEQHLATHNDNTEIHAVQGFLTWDPDLDISLFMYWLENGGPQYSFHEIPVHEPEYYYFYTCHISLKRSVFERIGLFDSELFYGVYDDLELGYRFFRSGLKYKYISSLASIHHRPVHSMERYCNERMVNLGRSYPLYASKVPPEAKKLKKIKRDFAVNGPLDASIYARKQETLLLEVAREETKSPKLTKRLARLYSELTDLAWRFGIWQTLSEGAQEPHQSNR